MMPFVIAYAMACATSTAIAIALGKIMALGDRLAERAAERRQAEIDTLEAAWALDPPAGFGIR